MLEEFTGWFRTLICDVTTKFKDPEVSTTSELFALANGPSRTPMSVNACVVDGVRYVVQSRDERRTTQNSGICAPGPDGEMSYGQLQEISSFRFVMADVARAHGGDGGGEDPSRPPPTSFGCAGCFINRGRPEKGPDQVLKDAVAANKGRPIEIGFEDRADNTVVPTGPYSTQWGNYFGEMIRSIPLYHPSWQKVPAGDKARLMATLGKMTSATQEEPSEIDTFYRLHTVNGVFQDPEALRMYDRMRELEATGEHTTAEINAMVRGGKLRGHIPGKQGCRFMMNLMRANRFADAFARYDSGGASGSGGSRARDREDGDDTGGEDGGDDTNFFRKKSGNAAVQAVYKKKLQTFPQRHVAGENPAKGQNYRGEKLKVKNSKGLSQRLSLGKSLQLT
ncbi:hypothetical protein Tco_1532130 [Tanacetum coccineum]